MSVDFYKKIMEISKVMEEKGDGISYIRNKSDNYTIGTKKYSEEIARYLDEHVESWEGSEAQLTKKKGKNKQLNGKKVGYLWKIPVKPNE